MANPTKTFGKLTMPLLVLLAISFSALPAYGQYGGGSGTAEDPYLIYTPAQMNAIGANQGDWNKHFKLMANINLGAFTGTSFNIIGTDYDNAFTGVFDGNGHTISNFTYTSTARDNVGLFGYARWVAEIKDVGLIDPKIDVGTGGTVGSLVGILVTGIISKCYVEGGSVAGNSVVGGLVGYNGGKISNCYSSSSVSGNSRVGGLVGQNWYGTITVSYSTGSVSGKRDVGGLVGHDHEGTITNCCSTGSVTGTERDVGGLVGYNRGTITNCYSTGSVSGDYRVGGLAGRNYDTITNCYSTGSVTGTTAVGGLVGSNYAAVIGSFWDIETSGQSISAGGTPKTTTEMQDPNTFMDAGWDFISQPDGPHDVWAEPAGRGYPILWWQLSPLPPLPTFSGGSGTADDHYLISTDQDLNSIGHNPRLMSAHFKLIKDIDLEQVDLFIIGSELFPFTGVFDGNGHIISNFTYDSNDTDNIGLFRYVDDIDAEIKDLGLIDPKVDAGTGFGVGSLVGRLYNGTITGCYVEGGSIAGDSIVSGLVGYNSSGTITNCYSAASVSGDEDVGGLVGYNESGTISNCYSTASVSGDEDVGGLVGSNRATITNCYSSGSVTGTTAVGGLVGSNYAAVIGSFWDIETSGQSTSDGGTGSTTAEMQTANTFIFWVCPPVWTINEGNDYPRLVWENAPGESITKLCYGGGSGNSNNPYLIYTAEQLNLIGLVACDLDKHFKLMADIDLSGFTGTSFNIIGYFVDWDNYKPFTGVFDGNGHTISNFSYISTGTSYTGLFGYIDDPNAEIKNLGLIDPNVDGGASSTVGSLVGRLYNGTITNCYIDGGSVSGNFHVGGLVGQNDFGTITNCYSTGSVSDFSSTPYGGIGGLVGSNSSRGTITNSYSSGSISGRDRIGGLVGGNSGTITNCCSTGSVTGTERDVGGLVGGNSGTITNCCSTGSVTGTERDVGGLVGQNSSRSTITNCYSTGSVSGRTNVGGLVGHNRGTISNCYSSGSVSGNYTVGGLVGENGKGSITNCYATGSVEGNSSVGGLVGHKYYGTVTASFWDIETSGKTTSAGGTGLPTSEMQMMSTFTDVGWDFTTPLWTIDEGVDYPRFWWELVPVLHTEAELTLGTSNTISWDPVPGANDYYAECAEDANFTSIIYNTGWITETSCEFTGLQLGQRYWYSVKARNSAGIESNWSNVESSLQVTLADAVETMLDPSCLKNKNMKNAFLNKVNEVLEMLGEDLYAEALNKLENDILQKTDGCAETGRPDKNDWIKTCEGQSVLYPLVIETIEYVKSLME